VVLQAAGAKPPTAARDATLVQVVHDRFQAFRSPFSAEIEIEDAAEVA
jgi:hypothetical protein